VPHERGADATPARRLGGVHRLDLAVVRGEPPQRGDPHHDGARVLRPPVRPRRPEGDVARAQGRQVERVRAPRRRLGAGALDVGAQQRDHARVVEPPLDDPHGQRLAGRHA
jgi:hypothetical protein